MVSSFPCNNGHWSNGNCRVYLRAFSFLNGFINVHRDPEDLDALSFKIVSATIPLTMVKLIVSAQFSMFDEY
ncbi:hypothetical protein SDJN02_16547, partial [Cucurbita argyrosperma subsp. argyrosperma]